MVTSLGASGVPVTVFITITGWILCLLLAELSAMMPERTGGAPSYAYPAFKDRWPGMAKHVNGFIGLCQVGARGRPVRRSHRGAGRLHTGQAPAQQASRTCSSPSSCHRVRPTPPVLGGAAAPG
jgi:hypothetical protein